MNRRDVIIIEKLIKEADFVKQMLDGLTESDFLNNQEKQRATVMTLLNIGELVKNLTMEFRSQHPQIPWKSIAGLRDVAAHGYFTLRMEEIWVYATSDLPRIISHLPPNPH